MEFRDFVFVKYRVTATQSCEINGLDKETFQKMMESRSVQVIKKEQSLFWQKFHWKASEAYLDKLEVEDFFVICKRSEGSSVKGIGGGEW